MTETQRQSTLSAKQSQVIRLILEGNTKRKSAKETGVAEETVSRWKSEGAQLTIFALAGISCNRTRLPTSWVQVNSSIAQGSLQIDVGRGETA